MRHERHYTLDQANAALPWVAERLERLRSGREGLTDEDARGSLEEASGGNGGGEPGRVVSEGFLALRDAARELDAVEILLRDLDRGLIDFPALLDGEEVYLCWEEGEEEIGYWHGLDAGFGGRQAL